MKTLSGNLGFLPLFISGSSSFIKKPLVCLCRPFLCCCAKFLIGRKMTLNRNGRSLLRRILHHIFQICIIKFFVSFHADGRTDGRTDTWILTKIAKDDCWLRLVRPSVRMEQLGSHWTDFHKIWYLNFWTYVDKIKVSLKPDQSDGYFTWRSICFLIKSRWTLLRMRNVWDKSCIEMKTHFMFNRFLFFRKSCRL